MRNHGLIEPVQITTAQRDSLIISSTDVGVIFNTDTNEINYWKLTHWEGKWVNIWAEFNIPTTNTTIPFTTLGLIRPPFKTLIGVTLMSHNISGTPNRWHKQEYRYNNDPNSFTYLINDTGAGSIFIGGVETQMVGELARINLFYV